MTTTKNQIVTLGEDSKLIRTHVKVVNKDCEEYVEYQIELKQYKLRFSRFHFNSEKKSSILLGICSPSIEQYLELIKMFEQI